MKRLILILSMSLLLMECSMTKGGNSVIYVYNSNDPRYLLYLDSLKSYEVGYSVSKNVADSVRKLIGNSDLDVYFLGGWVGKVDSINFTASFNKGIIIEIGQISKGYDPTSDDNTFPWSYVAKQYKRLDSIKIQPYGIMQGAELPDVYVYKYPEIKVIVAHPTTILDKTTRFILKNGRTKIPYNVKYYYSPDYSSIDSFQFIDPIKIDSIISH